MEKQKSGLSTAELIEQFCEKANTLCFELKNS